MTLLYMYYRPSFVLVEHSVCHEPCKDLSDSSDLPDNREIVKLILVNILVIFFLRKKLQH